jgi:autotransporter-associated beta strand protein
MKITHASVPARKPARFRAAARGPRALAGTCAALLLALGGTASAVTGTWQPSGGPLLWSEPSHWVGGIIPTGVGDTANFPSGGGFTSINLNGNRTLGTLNQGNFELTGNTLIFDAASGNATLNVAADSTPVIRSAIQLVDTLDINSANGNTLLLMSGVISGSGGLHIAGPSRPQLGLGNTYTGPTTVDGGASLTAGGGTCLPDTSHLTVNGSLIMQVIGLQASETVGSLAGGGVVTLHNSRIVVGADNTSTTFTGRIADSGNTDFGKDTSLTKIGTGTLTLSGQNTYIGGTFVNSGRLQIAGQLSLPSNYGVTLNGGTIGFSSGVQAWASFLTGSGTIDLDYGSAFTVGSSDTSTTFSGTLLGGGHFGKTGAGTLTITNPGNNHTGLTVINVGTLQISGAGSLYNGGAGAGEIVVNGAGTLLFNRSDTFGNHAALPNVLLTINQYGVVTNTGVFTTLKDININGGELRAAGGFASNFEAFQIKGTVTVGGTAPSSFTATGTTNGYTGIQIGNNTPGGTTTFNVADVTGNASPDLTIANRLLNGNDTAPIGSGLVKTGPGTLKLTAQNTYTGPTLIQGGTVLLDNTGFIGQVINSASPITITNATLRVIGSTVNALAPTSLTVGAGGVLDTASPTQNVQSFIGQLTLQGGRLTGTNPHPGFGNYVFNPSSSIVANGDLPSSIEASEISLQGNIAFNVGTGTGGVPALLTVSSNIRDESGFTGGITKGGPGVLVLTGINTNTVATTVTGGLIRFSAPNNFGSGKVTFNGGGLQWTPGNTTDISPQLNAIGAGGGTVDLNGNDVTFGTALSGGGALTKIGNGTLTFTAANNHLATTITGGTIRFSAANQFGANGANLTINGGTVQWAPGSTANISGGLNPIGANGATFDTNGNDVTFLTSMSGSGLVTKTGAGTLFWGVPNNHTGGTNITGGFIRVAFEAPLGTGNVTLNGGGLQFLPATTFDVSPRLNPLGFNGGTIDTNGATIAFGSALTGPGNFTKTGAGTLTLNGTNTYTGRTIVNGGTLQLGNSGTVLPDDHLVMVDAGTFALGSAPERIGVLSGSGGIVQLGNQTLTLSAGGSSYSGAIQGVGGSVVKDGPSNLLLYGASTFTGSLILADQPAPSDNTVEIGNTGSLFGGGTLAGSIVVGHYSTLLTTRSDTFGTATSNSPVTIWVKQTGVLKTDYAFNTFHHLRLDGMLMVKGGLSANYPAGQLKNIVTVGGGSTAFITTSAEPSNGYNNLQIGNNTPGGMTIFDVANVTLNNSGDLIVFTAFENSRDGSGNAVASGLLKTGPGTMVLSGVGSLTHTYTGLTQVEMGTLCIDATISGAVEVLDGATLTGAGSMGPVTVGPRGTLTPGVSPIYSYGSPQQRINTGDLDLQPSSHLALELGGLTGGANYDQVQVTGTVTLGGDLQLSLTSGFTPQIGDTFFVMLNDGADAISGAFTNAPGGHVVIPGFDFLVNYAANGDGGGNDVSLTFVAVPEPGTVTALCGGLALLLSLRRRRH